MNSKLFIKNIFLNLYIIIADVDIYGIAYIFGKFKCYCLLFACFKLYVKFIRRTYYASAVYPTVIYGYGTVFF